MTPEQLIQQLNWRYAVKKFDSQKKISDSVWVALEESLRLAPSSYGLQPWKFLHIKNKNIRQLLRASSWNQSQVEDASDYIVICFKEKLDVNHVEKYMQSIADQRQVSLDSLEGFKNTIIKDLVEGPRSLQIDSWAQRQCYISMGFLMLAAAQLGVDSCPLEGLVAQDYDSILNLMGTGFKTLGAVALGYRHTQDKFQSLKKVRFLKEDVFTTFE